MERGILVKKIQKYNEIAGSKLNQDAGVMQPATSLDFSYLKITSHSPFAEKYRRGLERKNSPTHYFTCRVSRVSRVSLGVFGCQGVNFSSPPQKILRLFTKCGVVVN